MSLSYNYPPQMAYPSAPPVYRSFPPPPRLHWGWVLALSFLTLGLFAGVWLVVEAWWVKKVTGNAKPFGWCLAYLLVTPATFLFIILGAVVTTLVAGNSNATGGVIGTIYVLLRLSAFVSYLVGAFTLKGALEAEPIDIPLSGVMTFFFAPIYFQYHLYDYSVEGKIGERLGGFGEPAVASAPAGVVNVPEVPPQV